MEWSIYCDQRNAELHNSETGLSIYAGADRLAEVLRACQGVQFLPGDTPAVRELVGALRAVLVEDRLREFVNLAGRYPNESMAILFDTTFPEIAAALARVRLEEE